MAFFDKLKAAFQKPGGLKTKFDDLVKVFQKVDERFFEELEEILITADIGMEVTMSLVDDLREIARKEKISDGEILREKLIELIVAIIDQKDETEETFPLVYLIVGVNGVGKTTTIGKLAHYYKSMGKTVMLAAGDTFRAAAIDQLEIWAERADVPLVKHSPMADPGAVIFDAVQSAKSKHIDVLICDTAGRLHNKSHLMAELSKLNKIITGEYEGAKREVLLVLDATTGQNAISQTETFMEATSLTGLVMTKLDGTAKGGILIALSSKFDLPVKFIGIGEGIDDFSVFDGEEFAKAIF